MIKIEIRRSWRGVPAKFKNICMSLYQMDGIYSHSDAIDFIKDMMNSISSGGDIDTFVKCVSRLFDDCMFPLELHEDTWIEYSEILQIILEKAEYFLVEMVGSDALIKAHKCEEAYTEDYDSINLLQDINAYLCFCHYYSKNIAALDKRLKIVLYMTINNTHYLIYHKDAEILMNMESRIKDDFYIKRMEYWREPLALLINEMTLGDQAELLAGTYCDYLDYLDYLISEYKNYENNKVIRTLLNFEIIHINGFIGLLSDKQIDNVRWEQNNVDTNRSMMMIDYYKAIINSFSEYS